ncbi:MAG: hypothetical protein IIB38_04455 [Candidatus Hydrogenedentes bacterium]|nr:hypothetical protein [Candidatus Hydrogenedentota bacterium]
MVNDLNALIEKWKNGIAILRNAKIGTKIIGEIGRTSSILRDLLNESFDSITADNKEFYEEMKFQAEKSGKN